MGTGIIQTQTERNMQDNGIQYEAKEFMPFVPREKNGKLTDGNRQSCCE